ncbi:MAG: hypothetical protein ACRDMZ_14655 [Solirubrobacteraceae bacterium]
MRIATKQVAAVEAAINDGRVPESERVQLLRNAVSFARHEPKVTAAEGALFAAAKAKRGGDLAASQRIMASAATDPFPVTVPAANGPREDGRYDLGNAPAPTPSTSSQIAATTRVEVDGGHMSFAGLPASIAQDGTPRVVTSHGAVTVETLRSLNLDMDYERLLHGSRVRTGLA